MTLFIRNYTMEDKELTIDLISSFSEVAHIFNVISSN
jgi:hypothetical protein